MVTTRETTDATTNSSRRQQVHELTDAIQYRLDLKSFPRKVTHASSLFVIRVVSTKKASMARAWVHFGSESAVRRDENCDGVVQTVMCDLSVRGVSWSEVATVPKRKSHRGLDLDLSLNSEEDIWKGRKESGGKK